MKAIIFHYGRIGALLALAGAGYLTLDSLINNRLGTDKLFPALTYIIFFVVPPCLLILAYPTHKLAQWAKTSHSEILGLSTRERLVLEWHFKKEKSDVNKKQLCPPATKTEYDDLVQKLVKRRKEQQR